MTRNWKASLNEDNVMTAVFVGSILLVAAGCWLLLPAAGLIVLGVSGVVTSFLYACGAMRERERE